MPSLGVAEILVIAIVALVFLGPDKLPKAARQLGKALRELRRHSENVKAELRDVVDIDGVTQMQRDFKEAVDFRSVLTDAPDAGRPANGSAGAADTPDSVVDATSLDADAGQTRRLPEPARPADSGTAEQD